MKHTKSESGAEKIAILGGGMASIATAFELLVA